MGAVEDRDGRAREFLDLTAQAAQLLAAMLVDAGLSRADLARSLGRTRGYVTQVLGGKNLTLRTVNEFAFELGYRLRLVADPLEHRALPRNVVRFGHLPRAAAKDAVDRERRQLGDGCVVGAMRVAAHVPSTSTVGVDAVAG